MESDKRSSESDRPGKLETAGPWACAVLGVLMIGAAAVGYLEASVSIAFVVVGAGLLTVGGFAARIEGTVKIGLQGFEVAFRTHHEARQALVALQEEAEKRDDPEEAKRLGESVERIDDWFEGYQAEVARTTGLSAYARAALMKQYWDEARTPRATGRYRGGAIVPGVDTEEPPASAPTGD